MAQWTTETTPDEIDDERNDYSHAEVDYEDGYTGEAGNEDGSVEHWAVLRLNGQYVADGGGWSLEEAMDSVDELHDQYVSGALGGPSEGFAVGDSVQYTDGGRGEWSYPDNMGGAPHNGIPGGGVIVDHDSSMGAWRVRGTDGQEFWYAEDWLKKASRGSYGSRTAGSWVDAAETRELGFDSALVEMEEPDGWNACIYDDGGSYEYVVYYPSGEVADHAWSGDLEQAKADASASLERNRQEDTEW